MTGNNWKISFLKAFSSRDSGEMIKVLDSMEEEYKEEDKKEEDKKEEVYSINNTV